MTLQIRVGEVPELIKKTAQEIAGCFYDMNRSDRFRLEAGTQDSFVRRQWKHYVHTAIENLAGVLGLPGTPEDQKELIHDAIMEFHERSSHGKPRNLSLRKWQ